MVMIARNFRLIVVAGCVMLLSANSMWSAEHGGPEALSIKAEELNAREQELDSFMEELFEEKTALLARIEEFEKEKKIFEEAVKMLNIQQGQVVEGQPATGRDVVGGQVIMKRHLGRCQSDLQDCRRERKNLQKSLESERNIAGKKHSELGKMLRSKDAEIDALRLQNSQQQEALKMLQEGRVSSSE
jgi:predicted nuclease with TOPRIM domain